MNNLSKQSNMSNFSKLPKYIREVINRNRQRTGLLPIKTRIEKIKAILEKVKNLKEKNE